MYAIRSYYGCELLRAQGRPVGFPIVSIWREGSEMRAAWYRQLAAVITSYSIHYTKLYDARLHAGGPYADAGDRVTAQLTPTSFVSKNALAKEFDFDTWSGDSETQTLHQSEENLDSAGDLTTQFTLDEPRVLYGRLRVESAVRDDRGKFVAGEASARFVGRTRFVGLRQPDWILQKGKAATIEALVVDEYGEPVAGTPVTLKVRVRVTTASRVKGAGNAYLTHYEHSWVDVGDFDLTPGKDPSTASFVPDRPGLYEITVITSYSIHYTKLYDGGWNLQSVAPAGMMLVGIESSTDRISEYTHVQDDIGGGLTGGDASLYTEYIRSVIRPIITYTYGEPLKIGLLGSSLGGLRNNFV